MADHEILDSREISLFFPFSIPFCLLFGLETYFRPYCRSNFSLHKKPRDIDVKIDENMGQSFEPQGKSCVPPSKNAVFKCHNLSDLPDLARKISNLGDCLQLFVIEIKNWPMIADFQNVNFIRNPFHFHPR